MRTSRLKENGPSEPRLHLNEEPDDVIREDVDTDAAAAELGVDETALGIYVTKVSGADAMDLPVDTGVVLEGAVVLKALGSVSLAFAMSAWADLCPEPA
ncbi:hypothetical protein SRHO_G00343940 [Serrasalmus rhombeus]